MSATSARMTIAVATLRSSTALAVRLRRLLQQHEILHTGSRPRSPGMVARRSIMVVGPLPRLHPRPRGRTILHIKQQGLRLRLLRLITHPDHQLLGMARPRQSRHRTCSSRRLHTRMVIASRHTASLPRRLASHRSSSSSRRALQHLPETSRTCSPPSGSCRKEVPARNRQARTGTVARFPLLQPTTSLRLLLQLLRTVPTVTRQRRLLPLLFAIQRPARRFQEI